MLLFAVTGITLNHAAQIEAKVQVHTQDAQLAPALRPLLQTADERKAPLPAEVSAWIEQTWGIDIAESEAEWSAEEIYVSLPRPGGDAWLSIDTESGAAR